MLELKEVSCFYGKVQALRGVSISVEEGSIVSLLGANGAGKTTCLKAISRIMKLQSGKVFFRGRDISNLGPADVVQMGLVQVPEGRMLFPQLTVEENLSMGAYCRKDRKAIPVDKERMYGYFPILGQRKRQIAATLSGGEQQMLAIARGLMAAPKILLLDEPSLGLAPVIVERIFAFIRDLKKTGTTVLLVEQNASMALKIADKAYVLETGAIVMSGQASELAKSEKVRASYLGIGI
ncbi:MAG: ABC transporter ATP-binding protein [Spirochaetales bacterium]